MTGIGRKWALLVHTPYGAGHGCNGFSDGNTSIRNGKQHLLRHRKRRERHDAEKEKTGPDNDSGRNPGCAAGNPVRHAFCAGVDARIIERLIDMAKAYGVKQVLFTSGYRSHEKQKEIYDAYIEGVKGANYAMEPYTSWHEYGGAVDIYSPQLQELPNAAFLEFGLSRPAYVPGDPVLIETWHVQLAENAVLEAPLEEGSKYYESIRQWSETGE